MKERVSTAGGKISNARSSKKWKCGLEPYNSQVSRFCQRDNTGLALACHTWLCLLKDEALLAHTDIVQRRFTQTIQPCHLVAYLLHPHYRGELFHDQQRQDAYQWLRVHQCPTWRTLGCTNTESLLPVTGSNVCITLIHAKLSPSVYLT